MTIDVFVADRFTASVDCSRLRRLANKTIEIERHPPTGVTIAIVGNDEIRRLNRKYHHVNRITDVLSFPYGDEDYLGDVVISYEVASKNARLAGWTTRNELELLTVHGLLHLLGYHDASPRSRARMWRRQEQLLGERIAGVDKARPKR